MCIEYAFKRGGISLIRNFLHQTEGVQRGVPQAVQSRLGINYKLRTFTNGKVSEVKFVTDPINGFLGKGDRK